MGMWDVALNLQPSETWEMANENSFGNGDHSTAVRHHSGMVGKDPADGYFLAVMQYPSIHKIADTSYCSDIN